MCKSNIEETSSSKKSFRASGLYEPTSLQYQVAEKLGWLGMNANVVVPAVTQIINSVPEGFDLLVISDDALFGLLLGMEDWAYQDLQTFVGLRSEIEMEMAAGHSYQEAIDEWFK